MVAWLVDGNALEGTIAVKVGGSNVSVDHRLLRGSTWRPSVSARNAVVEVPGRHGSVVSGLASLESALVTLVGDLMAPSEAALEAALARIQGMVSRPAGVVLSRVSGGVTATAAARLVSWSQDANPIADRIFHSGWTAVLTVPGVFFTAAPAVSAAVPATGTVALPTLAGSSAPIGDATIRVAGPATAFSAIDPVSGTGVTWTGSLPLGQYLYIWPAEARAHRTTSDTGWGFTGTLATADLDYPAAGLLQLWPRVSGDSTVVELDVTVTGGDGNNTIAVRAGRSFL